MTDQQPTDAPTPKRRPRIAIMGEFSSGKSTLCNLLMNGDTLPRKITATQLAPVWMTHGDAAPVRVHLDGHESPISLDTLTDIPVDDTLYIRLSLPQEIFQHCDFIDFPGISDPNMDPDVVARLMGEADAIVWLTHATQAWRQSEAAMWEQVPEAVQKRSLLLLTRWDKVTSDSDRARVYRRLQHETAGQFRAIVPISLVHAIAAGDDIDAWTASGGAALMDHLSAIMAGLGDDPMAEVAAPAAPAPADLPTALNVAAPIRVTAAPAAPNAAGRVVPRRVRPTGPARRERLPAQGAAAL